MSKAFVINACGTVSDEMREAFAYTAEDREFLADPELSGGSTIIGPDTKVLAGPMGPEEGILYADVDLEDCVLAKVKHDFAGHYNRADVFTLVLNDRAPEIFQRRVMADHPVTADRKALPADAAAPIGIGEDLSHLNTLVRLPSAIVES